MGIKYSYRFTSKKTSNFQNRDIQLDALLFTIKNFFHLQRILYVWCLGINYFKQKVYCLPVNPMRRCVGFVVEDSDRLHHKFMPNAFTQVNDIMYFTPYVLIYVRA